MFVSFFMTQIKKTKEEIELLMTEILDGPMAERDIGYYMALGWVISECEIYEYFWVYAEIAHLNEVRKYFLFLRWARANGNKTSWSGFRDYFPNYIKV